MDQTVDTVIIGGGPAGTSCAIELQKSGLPNLVIEKRSFPRDKTCAGLVTSKTQKLLERLLPDPAEIYCDTSDVLELYYGYDRLTESVVSEPFRLVKRRVLDSRLAKQYTDLGGNLLENTCCKWIDLAAHRLQLSNDDTVTFKHLVVADGALSSTKKMLGYPAQELAFCLETHVPKSKLPDRKNTVGVYFGTMKNGYAWVFPSGDEYCIGIIDLYRKETSYHDLMQKFLVSLGLDPAERAVKGAFVPYGKTVKQAKGQDDVILIGDAGGFVDPICGEGLYFSMATGIAAANAIQSHPETSKSAFLNQTTPFVKIIYSGARLQRIFFQSGIQKLFKRVVPGKNEFARFYADNLVSDYHYSYAQFWKLCRDYKKQKRDHT